MENQVKSTTQATFNKNEIPNEILGVKLSEADKERLAYGQNSGLLENLKLNDGQIKDGKIKLSRNKDGEVEVNFQFKNENLLIPNDLYGHKLSNEQKQHLANGKTSGPFVDKNGTEVFIKVDKELNRVVVSQSKELGIPKQIGEYHFSESEKNSLANGEKLPAKVYKGEDGYFIASIQITEDKKGIEFSSIKSLSQQEATIMIKELNEVKIKDKTVENIIDSTQDKKELVDPKINLTEAIAEKNYSVAHQIIDSGKETLTEIHLKQIKEHPSYTPDEKVAMLTSVKADPIKELGETKIEIEKSAKEEKKDKSQAVQKGANLIDKAFSGM